MNFCCVMKGCVRACCGVHRSSGLMLRRPWTKSIKASRLAISVTLSESLRSQALSFSSLQKHTSLHLVLLHSLPGHRVRSDDIWQPCLLKVLLARLLFRTMLPRILLHRLQSVRSPPKFIVYFFEKLSRLLADFEHPRGRQSQHFRNS